MKVSMPIVLSFSVRRFSISSGSTATYCPLAYSYAETISSLVTSPWIGQTFWYRMRLLHFLCRRWKPILPPPLTVAPYALTGTAIRLNFTNPSQLGRDAIADASFSGTVRRTRTEGDFANVIPARGLVVARV